MGNISEKKILLCVMDFWNAGAERMAYEIHKYLSINNFHVAIYSCRELNQNSNFKDYYYNKHKE
jgi:hypothetical protein